MGDIVIQGSVTEIGYGSTEMKNRLDGMVQKLDLMQEFFQKLMVKDQDYGTIPGTPKPTLYKAGAEKLLELYNYAPTVKAVIEERDMYSGFYMARVEMAVMDRKTGNTVAEGVGEANSYEGRYRWRWVYERDLPPGISPDTCVYKEYNGQHGPYKKYRVENDDMFSMWNTVLKMAKKRALVDASLSATRSAGLFTQDVEDFEDWLKEENETDGKRHKPGKKNEKPIDPPAEPIYCEGADCKDKKKVITDAQAGFSKKKFGKALCMSCQKKETDFAEMLAAEGGNA